MIDITDDIVRLPDGLAIDISDLEADAGYPGESGSVRHRCWVSVVGQLVQLC